MPRTLSADARAHYAENPPEEGAGFILKRINPFTGWHNTMYRAEEAGLDTEGGEYVSVCDKHGTCLNSHTWHQGRKATGYPEWCEECMALEAAQAETPTRKAVESPKGEVREMGVPAYRCKLVREPASPFVDAPRVGTPTEAAAYVRPFFNECAEEQFVVACLDTKGAVCGMHVLTVGGLACSIVEPRAVFRAAVLNNAASIICFHNHPSGNLEPSVPDVKVTKQLVAAGETMGIPVRDHIIVTDRGYTSLAERGLI